VLFISRGSQFPGANTHFTRTRSWWLNVCKNGTRLQWIFRLVWASNGWRIHAYVLMQHVTGSVLCPRTFGTDIALCVGIWTCVLSIAIYLQRGDHILCNVPCIMHAHVSGILIVLSGRRGLHKVRTLAPNLCGSSVWKLIRVIFLVRDIFGSWLYIFWKIFAFLI
jgi:hypothetical protein